MSNSSYWQRRQQQLNKALETDEAALKKRLRDIYQKEEKKLDKEIASYYINYGVDKVVEYRSLLQRLSDADYKLLMERMDDFEKKYPEYAHLMPVRESIYTLNRLEGLEKSVQVQQLELGIKEQAEVEKHLMRQAQFGFTQTMSDLGISNTFGGVDKTIFHDIVFTKWSDGKNFSDRIWGNREKLSDTLNRKIAAGFARGDKYDRMISEVRQRFSVSRNEAYRLIYTEGTFVLNESRARACEAYFDYYGIASVGDERVCEICQVAEAETSADPVRFDARVAGENFPPFHPWCRCSYYITVPDKQKWIDDYVEKQGGDPAVSDKDREYAEEILKRFDDSGIMLNKPTKSEESHYDALLTKLNEMGVTYNPVLNHSSKLSDEEIIAALSGGDLTRGSCASVGLAYIGQRQGWNVLDFRGGDSQQFFSNGLNLAYLSKADGLSVIRAEGKTSLTVGNRLLKKCETGKEYYLCVGRHASIVRKTNDGTLQYLELQSATRSGWTNFDGNPRSTLHSRFGCTTASSGSDFMIDIGASNFATDDFKSLLGYINTAKDGQRKGSHGSAK